MTNDSDYPCLPTYCRADNRTRSTTHTYARHASFYFGEPSAI